MTNRAQSESIGIILLTGIIVITVGVAGAVILSGPGMGSEQRVNADVSVSIVDDGVGITHEGGDPVPLSDLRVVVRNGGETWRPAVNASGLKRDDGDDQFEQGERWIGRHTLDTAQITTVRVIDAGSNTVLAEARRYPTQRTELTPTPSGGTNDSSPPSVQVESPDGGEIILGGSDQTVTWTASDAETSVESIDIEYSENGGSSWQTLTEDTSADGSETVQIPAGSTDDALIRVRAVDAGGNVALDQSNATFTVDGDQPSIDSISPNASAQADIDADGSGWEDVSVSWTASDPTTSVDTVTISIQNISTTVATVETAGASGTVDVTLPNDTAEDVYSVEVRAADDAGNIRIREEADGVVVGSGGNDTTPPGVTVDSPNGGEVFRGGTTTTIQWTASDTESGVDSVDIEYSTDNGLTWNAVVRNTTNDGTATWTVPVVNTTDALVRVSATDGAGNVANDTSNGTFTIDSAEPTISQYEVTNPSGGRVNVTFDADELLGDINVTLTRNGNQVTTLTESDFNESGNGPYTYSATYIAEENGDYTATLNVAADTAGNDGAGEESGTVKITGGGGNSPPTIQNFTDVTASANGDYVTINNVTATDADGIQSVTVEVRRNGNVLNSTTFSGGKKTTRISETGVRFDATIDDGTTYDVVIVATDTNGNSISESKQSTGKQTDATAPTIDSYSGLSADKSTNNVTVNTLNASDNANISRIVFTVYDSKGNEIGSATRTVNGRTANLSSVTISTNKIQQKQDYDVEVTVYDDAGNVARDSKTVTATK